MMLAFLAAILMQAPPSQTPMPGTYKLVAGESDDVKKAIEKVVSQMSFVTRGAARSRMEAKCIAYPSVTIATEGGGYRIQLERGSNVVVTPGGPAVPWKTPDGETVQIRLTTEFRQIIESKDGQRENAFSREGDRLIVRARLRSPRLPAPVEYKLVYR
jgi:hypothetical protein